MPQLSRQSNRSSRALRAGARFSGAAVASVMIIGSAPLAQPAVPETLPVAQVQDVVLTSFGDLAAAFDPSSFVTSIEKAFVHVLLGLANVLGVGGLTGPEWLDKFGLGNLTPNELIKFTGLGNMSLTNLDHLAGLFGLNQNPVSLLMAAAGVTDTTNLSQEIDKLEINSLPVGNLYDLIGLSNYQDSTLSDLATAFGIANDPVSNLYGLLGLNADSTLEQTIQAFGIGDTPVDTLLVDWDLVDQHINGYLAQLHVTPAELLQIFHIDPTALGSIWDPATDAFTAGTTIQQFADAAGLGPDTVDQLLAAGNLDDATLNDVMAGIGLQPDATVSQVQNALGVNNVSISDFLSGFGVDYYSNSTVGDLFSGIPGFQNATFGALLTALGLSDSSTLSTALNTAPAFGDNTLSELVNNFGVGDDKLSDLSGDLLGTTTVDQYLTDILNAL